MRQPLPDDWTLELDHTFSREDADDGETLFTGQGIDISAIVYSHQSFDSNAALRSYLANRRAYTCNFAFRPNGEGIVGRALLHRHKSDSTLLAVVACLGRIVRLMFRFNKDVDVNAVIAIWHSLQHDPPAWVTLCGDAEPPLAALREALEDGIAIEDAVEGVICSNQVVDAVGVLSKAAQSRFTNVRTSCCEALGQLGIVTNDIVDTLRCRLHDSEVLVRAAAAEALMTLGEPSSSIVDAMIEGLQKHEETMLTGEDRIRGVCGLLDVPDRYHAARILSIIGEAARPARDVLIEHQMDDSGVVRLRVAEALTNIGESTASVLPPLRDGLRNRHFSKRERIRFAKPLLDRGEAVDDILAVVSDILSDSSDYTAKCEALRVVCDIGRAARQIGDCIVKAIRDEPEEWGIKISAAQALLRIGERRETAASLLLDALSKIRDGQVRAEIISDLVHYDVIDADAAERLQ